MPTELNKIQGEKINELQPDPDLSKSRLLMSGSSVDGQLYNLTIQDLINLGFIQNDGSVTFVNTQSMGGYRLSDLAEPIQDNDSTRLIDLNNKTVWKTIEW